MKTFLTGVCGAAALSLVSFGPLQAASSDGDVRGQIEETFRNLERIIESGASADVLTRQMYTPDTVVVGGTAAPRVGIAAEEVAIKGFLDSLAPPGQRKCKFAIIEPASVSPTVAAVFTNLTCRGRDSTTQEPDQKYHVLYVLKKTDAGWRVSLEMFGNGLL